MIPIFDLHSDVLIDVANKREGRKGKSLGEWISFMKSSGIEGRIFSVWIEKVYKPGNTLKRALDLVEIFHEEASGITFVLRGEDLKRSPPYGILSLEGADPIYDDVLLLRTFYRLGIRVITLTWSTRNMVADGAFEERTRGGLTTFGIEMLKEMEKLGMIPDLSHISEAGFWDVMENYHGPVFASHSNCRAICDHPRNLKDEQLEEIARRGGIIGMTTIPSFVAKEEPTLKDFMRHLLHALEVAGEDHVAFGFDFVYYLYEGYKGIEGLRDEGDLQGLQQEMLRELSEREVRKICWENAVSFFRRSLK